MLDAITQGKHVTCFAPKCNMPLTGKRIIATQSFTAYLKIAEGCSNGCTYCAIPAIRGKFRSVPIEDVLAEAEQLSEQGVQELIVIAQDTTRYGEDLYGRSRLPELLTELCRIGGFRWIRVLYCYPDTVDDALLDNQISRADGLTQPAPASIEDRTYDEGTIEWLDSQERMKILIHG